MDRRADSERKRVCLISNLHIIIFRDPVAKEVITRYTVKSLTSAELFQTDSNGRQMIHRKWGLLIFGYFFRRNYAPSYTYNNTEPVSANYFPVTNRISLLDAKRQLTILTDRSQGGTSLADGQIELMASYIVMELRI